MATTQQTPGGPTRPLIDPDDTRQLVAARALVAQYLGEAHATETALVTTLQAHITMTPQGSYRRLLERHLAETRQHAGAIERRLGELGEGRGLVGTAVALVETAIGQVLALSKGPVDLLRGASGEEKLLKNAKDECATEALEIATYDALEAAARAVGDDETLELARRHRAQEEQMLEGLRAEIPRLTAATIRERVGGETLYDLSETGAADNVRDLGRRSRRFARDAAGAAADAAEAAGGAAPGRGEEGAADEETAPLPNYDRLSAAQVIARLRDLPTEELDAVAAYERGHRARSTVLSRVEQIRQRRNGDAARDLGRPRG
jgi:ferritin-like metal-binding protein YciE